MLSEDEKRGLRTPLCRTPVSDLLQFAAQFLPTTLYQSTLSDQSLFRMHSLPTSSTSNASAFQHDAPVNAVELSDDNASCDEVSGKENATASVGSSISDTVAVGYPPMPAMAHHVSEVQERILRGSSVNEDMCSPIQADTVDDAVVDPTTLEATPEVFPEVGESQECPASGAAPQVNKLIETPRSVTQRRSRIVARFGLASRSQCVPDSI